MFAPTGVNVRCHHVEIDRFYWNRTNNRVSAAFFRFKAIHTIMLRSTLIVSVDCKLHTHTTHSSDWTWLERRRTCPSKWQIRTIKMNLNCFQILWWWFNWNRNAKRVQLDLCSVCEIVNMHVIKHLPN